MANTEEKLPFPGPRHVLDGLGTFEEWLGNMMARRERDMPGVYSNQEVADHLRLAGYEQAATIIEEQARKIEILAEALREINFDPPYWSDTEMDLSKRAGKALTVAGLEDES